MSQSKVLSTTGNVSDCELEITYILPEEGKTAGDIFAEIQEKPEKVGSMSTASTQGSKTEDDSDASGSLTATLTIEYSRRTDSYGSYVKLTNVSGGYTRSDRQVRVIDQLVEYGCIGRESVSQSDYYTPTSSSWSVSTPSDWVYVEVLGMMTNVGATYTLELTRSSTSDYTWTLSINNSLYFDMLP